jgi:hypothetical protein
VPRITTAHYVAQLRRSQASSRYLHDLKQIARFFSSFEPLLFSGERSKPLLLLGVLTPAVKKLIEHRPDRYRTMLLIPLALLQEGIGESGGLSQ